MQKILATNCDLSERNKVLEHETAAKSRQIDQLQEMLKANQSENSKHKYRIGQVENDISKTVLENDILESKNKALTQENENMKLKIEQLQENIDLLEDKNSRYMTRLDLLQANENEHRLKLAQKEDWIAQHKNQIDLKNAII